MLKKLKALKKYSFEILLIICILFILVYGLYRKISGKKGSWSKYEIPVYNSERYVDNKWGKSKGDYNSNLDFIPESDSNGNTKKNGSSKGEEICRQVLEKIFRKSFNKCRPDFLRNPVTENFNLELDCYNEELGIALEYNGEQHYKYIPYFHKNKEAFLNQKYRDELKRRMCSDTGIILIEVPYKIKHEQLESYIISELRNKKVI